MKTLITLALFAGSAFGQLTTISQLVLNGDGTPFAGEVTIQVPPFSSRSAAVRSRDIWLCSSANIITGCAQQIVNGVLTVQLEPNGGGSPAGTSYFVSYYPDVPPGRRPSIKTEYWVVPQGGPYTIDQVKTSTPPVPTVTISPTQLNTTGYTTGQFPCVVGGTFLPCSPTAAAVWGAITGTLSNQADLQTALNARAPLSAGIVYTSTTPTGACVAGTNLRYLTSGVNAGRLYGCDGFWTEISYAWSRLAPTPQARVNAQGGDYLVTGDTSTNTAQDNLCYVTNGLGFSTVTDCLIQTTGSDTAVTQWGFNPTPGAACAGGAVNNLTINTTTGVMYGCIGHVWAIFGGITTKPDTVGTLGSCTSTNRRQTKYVTDANAPTFLGVVTGGGSTDVHVMCNGSAWVAF